jgi:hypothetical protein
MDVAGPFFGKKAVSAKGYFSQFRVLSTDK